jgi:hypothetical protein
MDLSPSPEDPLAQPTRSRIFSVLIEERGPLSTGEVAELVAFEPHDPDRAGCLVEVAGPEER